MKKNDRTGARQPPRARDGERVAERLRLLAAAIEKMREAIGKQGAPPNTVSMEFAKEHDAMLTAFIIAVGPYVAPLGLDIPANSYSRGCATLECFWKERRAKGTADGSGAQP